MKKIVSIVCFALGISGAVSGQGWSASVLLGASTYQGDLVEKNYSAKDIGFAFGVAAHKSLNDKFSVKASVNVLRISGDDADSDARKGRGISFTNNLINFGVHVQYDILGRDRFSKSGSFSRNWTPYVSLGLAGVASNPKITAVTPANYLQADRDNTPKMFFSLPIGIGVKFDLTNQLNLGLEWSSNPIFSDYLDGVSLSGEPDKKDWFTSIGVRLMYSFQWQKDLTSTMK